MGRKLRSAKGELVDFDLLRVKQEMESLPPPGEVKQRQEDIDRKLRRRARLQKKGDVLAEVDDEVDAADDEVDGEFEDSVNSNPKRKIKK